MPRTVVAQNRRARHDYFVENTFEAGLLLTGSEVKSLRLGRGSISEAYALERLGEVHLVNAHIPEYRPAGTFGHQARRPRKLLLHRREIDRLAGAIQREGMTLIPLQLYFNERAGRSLKSAWRKASAKSTSAMPSRKGTGNGTSGG